MDSTPLHVASAVGHPDVIGVLFYESPFACERQGARDESL